MPKVLTKANELTDLSVGFLSLVGRGANRIPFRLTKGDPMSIDFDLSKMFSRTAKADAAKAKVAKDEAAATAAITEAQALLTSAGYSVMVATPPPVEAEAPAASAAIENDKTAAGFDNSKPKLDANGKPIVDETDMAAAKPGEEKPDVSAKTPPAEAAAPGKEVEDEAEEDDEEVDPEADPKAKKNPKAKKPWMKGDEVPNTEKTPDIAALAATIEALTKSFTAAIDEFKVMATKSDETVKNLAARVETAERAVQKAEKAVTGIVLGTDAVDYVPAKKSAGYRIPPLLDTGFHSTR